MNRRDLSNVARWILLKDTGVNKDNYKQYKYHNKLTSFSELTDQELIARIYHVQDIYKGMKSNYARFAKEGDLKGIWFEQTERIKKEKI